MCEPPHSPLGRVTLSYLKLTSPYTDIDTSKKNTLSPLVCGPVGSELHLPIYNCVPHKGHQCVNVWHLDRTSSHMKPLGEPVVTELHLLIHLRARCEPEESPPPHILPFWFV